MKETYLAVAGRIRQELQELEQVPACCQKRLHLPP